MSCTSFSCGIPRGLCSETALATGNTMTQKPLAAVHGEGPEAALVHGQRDILEMIATGAPLMDTLDRLLRLIEAQAEEMLCSVLLLDDDGLHFREGAAPTLPG